MENIATIQPYGWITYRKIREIQGKKKIIFWAKILGVKFQPSNNHQAMFGQFYNLEQKVLLVQEYTKQIR